MDNLKIQTTLINADQRCIFSECTEDIDPDQGIGEIFRQCQREFGRCRGHVYVDSINTGKTRAIGWIFEKVNNYDRSDDKYHQETWASILRAVRPALPELVEPVDIKELIAS